jgi:hypothetical protein
MVYTLGFFSILAFGSILATAGFLLDVILKDAAMRNRLQFLTRKFIACIAWGIVYYLWDLVIATVRHGPGLLSTMTYFAHRLGPFPTGLFQLEQCQIGTKQRYHGPRFVLVFVCFDNYDWVRRLLRCARSPCRIGFVPLSDNFAGWFHFFLCFLRKISGFIGIPIASVRPKTRRATCQGSRNNW